MQVNEELSKPKYCSGRFSWLKKKSKKEENVAFLAAFFPSSGIRWGLAVHFLLEPFPVRLGITRPSICCPCTLWTEELENWASELSKCSGLTTHPQFNPSNTASHTETKRAPAPSVRNRPLRAVELIFLRIILYADKLQARVWGFVPLTGPLFSCGQIDEATMLIIGFQHGTSLLCAQLEVIVFDQHLIHGWLGSINSTDRRWHSELQPQKDIRAMTKHSKRQLFNCKLI